MKELKFIDVLFWEFHGELIEELFRLHKACINGCCTEDGYNQELNSIIDRLKFFNDFKNFKNKGENKKCK